MKIITIVDNYNIIKDKVNGNTVFYCTYKDSKCIENITVKLFKYILEQYIQKDYNCYIASEEGRLDDIGINWTYDVGMRIMFAQEHYGDETFSVSGILKDLDWYFRPDDFDILLYNYFAPDSDDYDAINLTRIEVDDKLKIIRLQ